MRVSSTPWERLNGEVASNTVGDRITASVTRGGVLLLSGLEVTDFSVNWDASRTVQGQCTVRLADPAGRLWPRTVADPLAPGGSRIHLAYVFGVTGTVVPLGAWRIRQTKPETYWQWRRLGSRMVWLPTGTVTIKADEETATCDMERLDPTERAPSRHSVLSEVAWLLGDAFAQVIVDDDVTDAPVPDYLEYGENRLSVACELLDLINATYRCRNDGALEIIPAYGIPAPWFIEPGEGGTLVSYQATMDDADIVNGVTSYREIDDELIVARARITGGPLAWGGPFGRVPMLRNSDLIESQHDADDDAAKTLARVTAAGAVPLEVATVLHPALELYDRIPVRVPRFPDVAEITGMVTRIGWAAGSGVTDKAMSLTVMVDYNEFENLLKGELDNASE